MRERRKFCKKRGGNFAKKREEIKGEAGKKEHHWSCGSSPNIAKISQKKGKVSPFFHNLVEGEERVT